MQSKATKQGDYERGLRSSISSLSPTLSHLHNIPANEAAVLLLWLGGQLVAGTTRPESTR